MDNILRNL